MYAKFIRNELIFDFVNYLTFKERPFRAKLYPSKIHHDLDKLKNDPKALKNYFKKFKTRIIFKKDEKEDEFIAISGETVWDTDKIACHISIWSDHFDTF